MFFILGFDYIPKQQKSREFHGFFLSKFRNKRNFHFINIFLFLSKTNKEKGL